MYMHTSLSLSLYIYIYLYVYVYNVYSCTALHEPIAGLILLHTCSE